MTFTLPTINLTAVSPLLALLTTAIVLLLLPLFFRSVGRKVLALLGAIGLLISAACLFRMPVVPVSGFDRLLLLDPLAIAVHSALLLAALLTLLISLNRVEDEYLNYGEYFSLLLFSLIGMMIVTSTWNLLVLFLGLELFSIALYALAGIRKMRADSVEASLKYLLLGAFASGFLLYGMALLYGASGTLQLNEMMQGVRADASTLALIYAGVILLFIGLSFKAALVPFHMWTPDVYEGSATPVSAFMSTATKAAAFIVLIRLIAYSEWTIRFPWPQLLIVLAVLTMTVGNLLAIQQKNVKRMLAYSSISHAGYLLVGLTAASTAGDQAVLFYLFVYTAMNIGAFGVLSHMGVSNADERVDFESYRGMGYRSPFAALCLAVFMFSLSGLPPFSGFIGKLYLFSAAVEKGYVVLVVVAVLNSVVSVYYYMRLVVNLYMRDANEELSLPRPNVGLKAALFIALLLTILWGVYPSLLTDLLAGISRPLP